MSTGFFDQVCKFSMVYQLLDIVPILTTQLCSSEADYIGKRTLLTDQYIYELFATRQLPQFDYHNFWKYKSKPIQVALVLSGGGFRSMLTGAGILQAYDDRTPDPGSLSGLLQSITYFGGISGGAWLVMSNFVNDFKPMHQVLSDNDWALQTQLLEGIPNFDPKNMAALQPQSVSGNSTVLVEKQSRFSLLKKYFRLDDRTDNSDKNESTFFDFFKRTFLSRNITVQEAKESSYTKTMKTLQFYNSLHFDVLTKKAAGFPVSFTDYWGKALSKKLFTAMKDCPGITLTSSTQLASFQTFQQPFPIICSVERDPVFVESHNQSHLFEISPYEFGSWDSYLQTFVPLKYLGTPMFGGYSLSYDKLTNKSMCVSGFDNAGFITGTSSSLFNHVVSRLFDVIFEFTLETTSALENILEAFGISLSNSLIAQNSHPEYALYSPNPFYGMNDSRRSNVERDVCKNPNLFLVDGGDDGQNIPFHPFLRKERPIDLIFAYDMSSDKFNYPNGSSLMKSARRYHNSNASIALPFFETSKTNNTRFRQSIFPDVPSPQEFIDLELKNAPIFLGCELSDYPEIEIKSAKFIAKEQPTFDYLPPLIIYQANINHSFPSNTSTFQLTYTDAEVDGMITNGYNMATYKNATYYPMCVRCALIKREFDRIELGWNPHYSPTSFQVPAICVKCFDKFCWKSQN